MMPIRNEVSLDGDNFAIVPWLRQTTLFNQAFKPAFVRLFYPAYQGNQMKKTAIISIVLVLTSCTKNYYQVYKVNAENGKMGRKYIKLIPSQIQVNLKQLYLNSSNDASTINHSTILKSNCSVLLAFNSPTPQNLLVLLSNRNTTNRCSKLSKNFWHKSNQHGLISSLLLRSAWK